MNDMTEIATSARDTSMTMADLIDRVTEAADLSETRRRNLASSIRVMCRVLGRPPESLPASFEQLRERLGTFHPLSAGIKPKRWQNVRSDVASALRMFGPAVPTARAVRVKLSPEWQRLREAVNAHRNLAWKLSRLAGFCSTQGVEPSEVDDSVMSAYADMVRSSTFKTEPERHHREVCMHWNRAAGICASLALSVVTLPSRRPNLTPRWDELHPDFRAEAKAWLLRQSTEGDILDEMAPARPLRPASVKSYRYAIRQAVAGLAATETPLEQIRSLTQLIDTGAAKAILKHHLDRTGEKRGSMIAGIANVLVRIAETVPDPDKETVAQLRLIRLRLTPKRHGLSARPKAALRQFADTANIERLLILPIRIHDRVRRQKAMTRTHILDMQAAVALELLLMRPIRRENLVRLRIGENLRPAGDGYAISIPGDEVKNGDDLDYPVPPESARLIRFYIDKVLPQLGPNPDGWLFPGQGKLGHKAPETLARNFKRTVREWTGLDVYPHLMRHIGASLHLEHHPDAFDTVRRVLGHRSLDTTMRSYAQTKDSAAVRRFDALVQSMRAGLATGSIDD